jgi:predicted RecA/RadA family phage recombinase
MMGFVVPGRSLALAAPYAVVPGDGVVIGALFGVAAGSAALGEPVEVVLEGEVDLPKVAPEAWVPGQRIFWDRAARRATTVIATNTLVVWR